VAEKKEENWCLLVLAWDNFFLLHEPGIVLKLVDVSSRVLILYRYKIDSMSISPFFLWHA
jgi:hypothetical protein